MVDATLSTHSALTVTLPSQTTTPSISSETSKNLAKMLEILEARKPKIGSYLELPEKEAVKSTVRFDVRSVSSLIYQSKSSIISLLISVREGVQIVYRATEATVCSNSLL